MAMKYEMEAQDAAPGTGSMSGATNGQPAEPKSVSFELILPEAPAQRARLPMKVQIYPHDSTESIITTVKNFFGLYERGPISFEDKHGNTLIAQYENFSKNMNVFVRQRPGEPEPTPAVPAPAAAHEVASPRRARLGENLPMLAPGSSLAQPTSRPSSRTSRRRSKSPTRGRRSDSASTVKKSRPAVRRGPGSHQSFTNPAYNDAASDYSDSDGEHGSVTSSRRSKMDQVASADISLDNIVEGGRRKRAKFDSSELPLFVPPQVPMTNSLSSISPQRRIGSQNGTSPFTFGNSHTFSYTNPLASPQSFGPGDNGYVHHISTPYQAQGYRQRGRGSAQYVSGRTSGSSGLLLPTPDPTVGSVISDEDVALQLMRLGDASNFSTHGRTSTSTLDDALSGKAEAASSGASEDESEEDGSMLPANPYTNGQLGDGKYVDGDDHDSSGDEYEENDESFKGESDEMMVDDHGAHMHPPPNKGRVGSVTSTKSRPSTKPAKSSKPRPTVSKKPSKTSASTTKIPISPTSLPPQSRKTSSASLNFQAQLGADEEDLSTKPRCQRCRKSKKGCDRQRPCQRCKDAGIGIEGCISEEEGNGRKGRYGRHMGVPVRKTSMEFTPTADVHMTGVPLEHTPMGPPADKNKKRKR